MIVRTSLLCLVGASGPSEVGQPAPHSCPVTHITCTVVSVYRRGEGQRGEGQRGEGQRGEGQRERVREERVRERGNG